MKTTILEKIYRRLLKESGMPNVNQYGVYATSAYDATAYDMNAARQILKQFENSKDASPITVAKELRDHAVVGFAAIVKTPDPCWDAYAVGNVAGPGKLVYGMAYAMSPSGRLISDRFSMTNKAVSAWKGMAAGGNRTRKELDDVKAPRDKQKTPDFPDDDCRLRSEDFLNYAYESEGWEKPMFDTMSANNQEFMASLTENEKSLFEKSIVRAGNYYFAARYQEST